MKNITNNEMILVLMIFKSPEVQYNASSISKFMGISRMGALKIARKLESENILISKELGKAKFYRLNLENDYVKQYLKFLLKREAEIAAPYIKVWISEIRKIENADSAILFGSVLKKQKEARDIDVLFITNQKIFPNLKRELDILKSINVKNIHPVYQTKEDFIKNIKSSDKIVLNAIKGIVVFGEDMIIDLLKK